MKSSRSFHNDEADAKTRPQLLRYQEINAVSLAEAEQAVYRNKPDELSSVVVGVALGERDGKSAEEFCVRLAAHSDANVRGNAILGLGHIARIHRSLDLARVTPLVLAALADADPYVRGHADSAVSDIEMFLGVKIR